MTFIQANDFFTWYGWVLGNPGEIIYYDIEFLKDFGIFSKGEEFDEMLMTFNSGIIKVYNKKVEIKRQYFSLIPN